MEFMKWNEIILQKKKMRKLMLYSSRGRNKRSYRIVSKPCTWEINEMKWRGRKSDNFSDLGGHASFEIIKSS